MIENLLKPLVSARFADDPRYRQGHIRILNVLQGRRILGVHVPEMRALAKTLAKNGDAAGLIASFEQEAASERTAYGSRLCYEELVVWGLLVNYVKVPIGERLSLVRKFVPYIDCWPVCDLFDSAAKWIASEKRKNPLPVWDMICGYFRSDKEFEVRFAVVVSMIYFLEKEYLPELFEMIDRLDFGRIESNYISVRRAKEACGVSAFGEYVPADGKGVAAGEPPFYVRMAVAWFLATSLAKFPDETRSYMNVSRLPEDVRKLYARKARESFRTRDVPPFMDAANGV